MNDRAAAACLGLCLLCLYLLTAGGHYGGDGFWNYLTAESLVLDGDLAIGDRPFLVEEMENQYTAIKGGGAVAASGRRYSKYGLGLPLIEAPFYAAGHLLSRVLPGIPSDYLTMFAVSMTNTLICALWCLIFFDFARRLGYSAPTCAWLAGAFGLGSPVFPYAGYGFSESLIGLGLLGGVSALHRYKTRPSNAALLLAGLGLGLALITKLYIVLTLPLLLIYLLPGRGENLSPLRTLRAWTPLLLPLLLAGLLVAWHNGVRYGSPFKTGYHLDDLARAGGYFSFSPLQILEAAFGLTLSPGRGLLFFLPAALLTPPALRRFAATHPAEARLFWGLIAIHFLLYLPFRDWHGGSCWGPRYLLPLLPFLILPLGRLIRTPGARLLKSLIVAGLLVQIPAVLANPHLFVRFVQDKQVGAPVFFPGHPGDMLFSPALSSIPGGYYQLASALARLLTGTALAYPLPSGAEAAPPLLTSYDLIDTWWANALRTGILGARASAGLIGLVLALAAAAFVFARKFLHWTAHPVPSTGAAR